MLRISPATDTDASKANSILMPQIRSQFRIVPSLSS
ncbi:hypothetical protein SAMN06297468_1619 [Altererythrobacter xiamenensis]|uniref:Uncharacterized protein n=1 Tax=Altererythrobacter xiamenensis TaxID=1316679 RepID=A0A1Y6F4J3_9SPHN|nr:hypothetical protein SAMN06297468_1619 [Altererythrobacter xiamenensis]